MVCDPVVAEADKNDSAKKRQVVAVPCTLCGAIERAEDVHFFKSTCPPAPS